MMNDEWRDGDPSRVQARCLQSVGVDSPTEVMLNSTTTTSSS
jgi:hypothetical protein